MADYRIYQPIIKDANSVLVGVAQVRVGKPSVRKDASLTATVGAVQAVGKSDVFTDATDGTTECVKPQSTYTANVGTGTPTATGTYTGTIDGCFIVRLTGSAAGAIYAPDGTKTAISATAPITHGAAIQGMTFAGTITGGQAGDTWVFPAWASAVSGINKVQTGICSPYSLFSGSNESVGGLKSASFNPKIDETKTLSSGFPEVDVDRIITKTSVSIQLEAQEYTNANMIWLKNMVNEAINNAATSSVPVEVVMRTRGNSLISFWCPNCTIETFPTYSPGNDFSSFSWALTASKVTEVTGGSNTYNAWLRNTSVFYELLYQH